VVDSGKVAVVTGHLMFWPKEEEARVPVYTQHDLDTFTHIIYLDVPTEVVTQRYQDDTERSRPSTSNIARLLGMLLSSRLKLNW
jgi:shikimate kinase